MAHIDLSNPEVKAEFDALAKNVVNEALPTMRSEIESELEGKYKGLVEKNSELLSEKKTEAARNRELMDVFGKRKPEEVKEMLQKLENDENAELLRQGDLEGYNKRLSEKMEADYDAKLEGKQKEIESATKKADLFAEQVKQLKLDSVITSEYMVQKGAPTGLDDAISRARRVFDFDEDNQLVARDEKNNLMKGESGLLSPAEWMSTILRESAPHLFPAPAGSGAPGSKNNGGVTKKYADMNEAERVTLARTSPDEFTKLRNEFHETQ